ncbi:hypothetical protein TNCV_4941121 [Trichonephila clavipes]|nr:hypothetical protein TNCV_4941121 [Trichonephila clavipes]
MEELSNSAKNQFPKHMDLLTLTLIKVVLESILFTQMMSLNPIPKGKISSNCTCELMAIKGVLDNYHNRETESSSGILLFSDSKSALQAILKGNSRLTQDIIAFINWVFSAQRTCTLQQISTQILHSRV